MVDHPDTWARIIEIARARFPGNEPAVQAFARDTYDAEDTVAYAAAQDADDEEQAVLDAARRAGQLQGELCAELRDEATASASADAGRSARAVAQVAHADVLHANRPPGWAASTEVDNEVDDDESDDFADFNNDEDALDPADKQRAPMASFEMARRDQDVQQFMATERQAHQKRSGTYGAAPTRSPTRTWISWSG
jgi:hypothetical protein